LQARDSGTRNPREHRRFSYTWKSHRRDRTGWLPLGYASVGKKLVIVPEEAETVRTIFRLYLECGSVGALAEELGRRE